MRTKHFIIFDSALLDSMAVCLERMKVPNNLLPTHHIFRTRKAANIYMKELETVLKYPKGAGYLQVVQINAPKEIN